MFHKVKKLFVFTVAFSLLFTITSYGGQAFYYDGQVHDYNEEEINIIVNGVEINTELPPISIGNSILVTAETTFVALGATVEWNEITKEIYFVKNNNIVVVQIDNKEGTRNGIPFTMEIPPKMINGIATVPVRELSQVLGFIVNWDSKSKSINISDSQEGEIVYLENGVDDMTVVTPGVAEGVGIVIQNVVISDFSSGYQLFEIKSSVKIEKYNTSTSSDKTIIIDIHNAELGVPNTNMNGLNSPFVNSIHFNQYQVFPEKITRVIFELNSNSSYHVGLNGDSSGIVVSFDMSTAGIPDVIEGGLAGTEPPISNTSNNSNVNSSSDDFSYNGNTKTITLKKRNGLSLSQIKENDNYTSLKYLITLPYSGDGYKNGTFTINDNYINNIVVKNTVNGTEFVINEKQILAYTLSEDNTNIYIKIQKPKEKYEKIVLLDPGHGGNDPEVIANGITGKNLNLELALKIENKFQYNDEIKIYLTRIDDSRPENQARANMANDIADLFISIHQNSAGTLEKLNKEPNGTEVLYKIHSNETNSQSGKLTSKLAAEIMQKKIVSALGTKDRGAKLENGLLVLNQTKVPAILVEVCFISNTENAAMISKESNQNALADAVHSAITELMKSYTVRL